MKFYINFALLFLMMMTISCLADCWQFAGFTSFGTTPARTRVCTSESDTCPIYKYYLDQRAQLFLCRSEIVAQVRILEDECTLVFDRVAKGKPHLNNLQSFRYISKECEKMKRSKEKLCLASDRGIVETDPPGTVRLDQNVLLVDGECDLAVCRDDDDDYD